MFKEISWIVLPTTLVFIHLGVLFSNGNFDPLPSPEWKPPKSLQYEDVLKKVKKNYLADVYGLESLVLHEGTKYIYASSKTGHILQLSIESDFKPVIKHSFDYGVSNRMKRPLGMRFSPWFPDLLYFVDAYQGIFILDTVKNITLSVFGNTSMPYLNDFDFLWNGDLILSEPSTDHLDDMFHRIVLEGRPNGRLLRYSPNERKFSVILDGLYTPNGVQASPDRKCIYFSEMLAYRIQRVDFHESSDHTTTVILDGLPGMPDNIRFTKDQKKLIIPLPEERLDLPLDWRVIKHYVLFVYEKFLIQEPPYFGEFAEVLFFDIVTKNITNAWRGPTGENAGGITQVLEIEKNKYLLGSDTAPALFSLEI